MAVLRFPEENLQVNSERGIREALARLCHLLLAQRRQPRVEMHRIDAGRLVMLVEGGLAVTNQMDEAGH